MIRKESAFNQSNEEAAKRNKKDNIFKGKRVVETPKNTNQMDVDQAVEVLFQEDIVMDILSRLPVKSLLRFKCVSKLWRTLISDPYFKRKHLNRAMNDQDSRKFLISQVCGGRYPECYFYRSSFSSVRLYEDLQRLDYPYCEPWCHNIYSCCDGLFLIGALDYRDRHHRIFLWNPSMRESTVLPNPELPPSTQKTGCTWGLGYDSISDDYKILKISGELCSEIFALKSGSWRKIDNHPTAISPELSGMDSLAFVHGAFHWLGFSINYSVVSFSISNEVYREISLPKRMCSMSNAERGVSVLRGMLCCYSSTSTIQGMGTFNIWLMRDYGVKESWSNVFIMENQGFCSAIPKYGFTDLDFLLRCRFKKRVGTKFTTSYGGIKFWPQRDSFTDVVVYTESLISPKLLT